MKIHTPPAAGILKSDDQLTNLPTRYSLGAVPCARKQKQVCVSVKVHEGIFLAHLMTYDVLSCAHRPA